MNLDASPINFANPPALGLLVLLIGIYWLHRKSLRFLRPVRRRLSLALRVLVLTLLVCAIARPVASQYTGQLDVAFLVDVSDSLSPEQQAFAADWLRQAVRVKRSSDHYEVIAFGGNAAMDQPLSSTREVSDIRSKLVQDRTDLAGALQLASVSLPGDSPRKILLLSDGNQNVGDARDEAMLAAGAGIPVSFVQLPPRPGPEVLVTQVTAPEHLREGDTFPLRVTIDADHDAAGKLYITVDGELDSTHALSLTPGSNTVAYIHEPLATGFHSIQTHLETMGDTIPENNVGAAYISVAGRGRVLVVEGTMDESRFVAEALRAGGVDVEVRDPPNLPTESPSLRNFDSIVLVNVRADRLSSPQQQALASYVQNFGGGLMVVGGDESFGVGAYARTPLEELLPVRSDLRGRELESSVALFLVIDRSGSMGEGPGRGATKIDLAKRAALDAIQLLNERDQIGALAFDDQNTWIVPPSYLTNPEEVKRQIATLGPGGGTSIYPALLAAYQQLSERQAKVRHIILMTDGLAPDGDYKALTAQMRAQGITVSTIAIGTDADLGLMQRLAAMGNGRYYEATDPFDVPQLTVKETMEISRAAIVEQTVNIVADPASSALLNVDLNGVPPLLGYVATTAKPASTVILATGEGDPLLAEWQSGLGRVVAWTSDAENRWSSNWLIWPGFNQFWTALAKRTIPADRGSNLQVTMVEENGTASITVDSRAEDGSYLNLLQSVATVTMPDGAKQILDLQQNAPGRYAGSFAVTQQGAYAIDVTQRFNDGTLAGNRTAGFVVPYAAEYGSIEANTELLESLASITGGSTLSKPSDAFRPGRNQSSRGQPLWPLAVTAAMVLFLLDVATRRLRVEPSDILAILRRIPEVARRRVEPVIDTPGSRLLLVKRRIVQTGDTYARHRAASLGTASDSPREQQTTVASDKATRASTSQRLIAAKRRAGSKHPPS